MDDTLEAMMVDKKFRDDFHVWRKSRAEYKELIAAIRAGQRRPAVEPLAEQAGLLRGELKSLIGLADAATAGVERVKELPNLKKKLARLDAEVEVARKAVEGASAAAYPATVESFHRLQSKRDQFRRIDVTAAVVAEEKIKSAQSEGLM